MATKGRLDYSEKVSRNAWTQGQNTRNDSVSPLLTGLPEACPAENTELNLSEYSIFFTMTDRLEGQ